MSQRTRWLGLVCWALAMMQFPLCRAQTLSDAQAAPANARSWTVQWDLATEGDDAALNLGFGRSNPSGAARAALASPEVILDLVGGHGNLFARDAGESPMWGPRSSDMVEYSGIFSEAEVFRFQVGLATNAIATDSTGQPIVIDDLATRVAEAGSAPLSLDNLLPTLFPDPTVILFFGAVLAAAMLSRLPELQTC